MSTIIAKNRIAEPASPVVELDSHTGCAYIRFSHKKVAKTQPIDVTDCFVSIDTDLNGEVIGIELVGVKEFSITSLLEVAGMERRVPKAVQRRARYVPSLQTA